ncbi:MAG: ABC transporter ATP-binding protein [Bdellovibrionales bacterium]
MKKPLEIKNVTKKYGDFTAVNDVSFDLEEGEIFGLLGPNGAGKTTLISCIVTLEQMTKGSVTVLGHDIYQDSKKAKTLLGYVPQEVINHGYFTVREILQFYSGYFGLLKNNDRIDYLLEKLALTEHKDKKVKHLSGGMKRRLMIAKALVHKPKVLLLDEPTAGVDIELRNSLWDFVLELKKSGTTVLLTTHYLEEAESLCDRVAVINKGEIKKIGKTTDLISELTFRKLEIQINGSVELNESEYIKSKTENTVCLEFPSTLQVGEVLSKVGLSLDKVTDLQLKEGSLEEAFLRILGGKS